MRNETRRATGIRTLKNRTVVKKNGNYFDAVNQRVNPGQNITLAMELANRSGEDAENILVGFVPGPHTVNANDSVNIYMYRIDQNGNAMDSNLTRVGRYCLGDMFELSIQKGWAVLFDDYSVTMANPAQNFTPYMEYYNAPPANANVVQIDLPYAPIGTPAGIPGAAAVGGPATPVVRPAIT